MSKRRDTGTRASNGGDLTRLVQVERRLDAMLAETHRRAAVLVEGARKKALARSQKFDKEIAEATARLRHIVKQRSSH